MFLALSGNKIVIMMLKNKNQVDGNKRSSTDHFYGPTGKSATESNTAPSHQLVGSGEPTSCMAGFRASPCKRTAMIADLEAKLPPMARAITIPMAEIVFQWYPWAPRTFHYKNNSDKKKRREQIPRGSPRSFVTGNETIYLNNTI